MGTRIAAAAAALALVGAAAPAGALSEVAVVPVGPEPALVAVNPLTNRVYVAATGSKSGPGAPGDVVSIIDADLTPPAVVATVPVGVYPYGIDVNPLTNKVYVSNFGSGTVSVIDDAASPPTVKTIPGVVPGASGVAVNPITNLVYVVSKATGSLAVISGITDTILTTFPVTLPSKSPILVEVNPLLNRVYVPEWTGGVLHVLDGLTGAHLAAVGFPPFAFGSPLGGVAIHPRTQDVYVTNEKGGIYRVDGLTHALEAMAPVGVPPSKPFGTWGVEVNALKEHVYVAQFETNAVHVIDATTLAPLGVIFTGPTGTGPTSGPHFTALNPLDGKLYVTNELAGTVSVVTDP